MKPIFRRHGLRKGLAFGLPLVMAATASATVIASDQVLEGSGTTGYATGTGVNNLNGQAPTSGTTGYFTGTPAGNQTVGWNSGTGAFTALTGGITHPYVVNPATGADARIAVVGNANNRIQYRDFASTTPVASNDYYFSVLMRQSATTYTATTYIGVSTARASGGNAAIPATGFEVGFVNGSITLFYGNGTAAYGTSTLLVGAAASATYMAVLHLDIAAGTITPTLYDGAGALLNNPAAQTVSATVSTADLGAFYLFASTGFTGNSQTAAYDELRFGTALGDVMIPEPSVSALVLGGLGMLGFRRRRA